MIRKEINDKFKALYDGRVRSEPFLEFKLLESVNENI